LRRYSKASEPQSRKTLNQMLTEMDGFEQNEGNACLDPKPKL
jgi:ATP-dependent Zn protease